jgi:hypothetical protein
LKARTLLETAQDDGTLIIDGPYLSEEEARRARGITSFDDLKEDDILGLISNEEG